MYDKEKFIYAGTIKVVKAAYNNKHKTTDTRRKIFCLVFTNGAVWWPKDKELEALQKARKICLDHNKQFPDPDKPKC